MALDISRGIVRSAQKVVIYGVEGIGKSTLASKFPDPLFIDTEGSTKHMDVARLAAPKSWSELLQMVSGVKAERPCRTLVIDTIDWAERLAAAHVVSEAGSSKIKSIEDFGYGGGYVKLVEEFSRLLDRLSDVADAGINVVLVAHADIRKFEQPDEAASYDRWELKLTKSGQKKVAPVVKEWADAVLFLNYRTVVESVSSGMGASKGKARGGSERVMHTTHHACWDAKNRWGLEGEQPMDYSAIAPFIPEGTPAAPTAAPMAEQPDALQQAMEAQRKLAEIKRELTPDEANRPLAAAFEEVGADGSAASGAPDPAAEQASLFDGRARDDPEPKAPLHELHGLPEFWEPALRLMEADGVTVDEIVAMSAAKGFFTADTPPQNYPKEYVEGAVVAQWEKTKANVEKMRAGEPL